MRLYLINPSNPLISIVKINESRWNRYRVWKPLSLMVLAGLTPADWEISIVDENLDVPDYAAMPRPDLVGITAFTSQANRAYEVAAHFRGQDVPVVMGGIHATMCQDEVSEHVDSIVTKEADKVWPQLLEDVRRGRLQRRYDGGFVDMADVVPARHDLLSGRYAIGAIQTTRGCPLNCSFCSVTAFNGARYRQRPIPDVVREFQSIRERLVLVVDDNLIGTRPEHIARAKDLFRAMAGANLRKEWIAQATINFADDEELLSLAAKAGCSGVFIGFESPSPEGLKGYGGKFNLLKGRDIRDSVRRIQRHNILVAGSFIIGLDVDEPGIGSRIAEAEKEPAIWEDRFYEALQDFRFLPAGRILSGAGTDRNVTLFNCFVMGTIPDDMAGIFDALKEAALTMQQGGGIGYDFSTLRPKGAPVKGVGADASGPLSFMDVWDAMCRTIMSAGSRRGAMMAVMRCDHPDIEAFIEAKREPGKLRMFNLSVLVTDAFMEGGEGGRGLGAQVRRHRPIAACRRANCGTRSCGRPTPMPNPA